MATTGRRILMSGLACGAMLFATAPAATAAEWEWSITPYLWAAGLELDVDVNDDPAITSDVGFDDLVDKLDFAGQVHFEGQTGQVGFFVDLEFYDFNDDEKTFTGGAFPAELTTQGDFEMWIIEAGALWNPSGEVTGFALLGGTRIFTVNQDIEFEVGAPVNASGETGFDATLVDVMLGGRYQLGFDNGWTLGFRGDVSTGDTDLTWNAVGNFGYSFGSEGRFTILSGYRHMVIDLDDEEGARGGTIDSELTFTGPFVAFRFGF